MSLKSWLEQRRQTKQAKAIIKNKKRIKTKFGQGEDRYRATQFFTTLGGHDGYLGLLERYMVNVEPSIKDENEKSEIYETLVKYGDSVVPAIEEYINRRDAAKVPLTWPLKILDAVCKPEDAASVIIRALEKMGTQYVREPERKVLLISQLAEYEDDRVVETLIPFLRDHRDEVQLEAITALTRIEDDATREPMLELMIDEESSIRMRAAVASALSKLEWTVKGYRKKVEQVLPEGLFLDRAGRIRGRWVHAPQEEDDEES
jgi:hypothetical protein